MDCPRCGGDLEAYTLGGRDAKACNACGFVGIKVEHNPSAASSESWEDAIDRASGQTTLLEFGADTHREEGITLPDADNSNAEQALSGGSQTVRRRATTQEEDET